MTHTYEIIVVGAGFAGIGLGIRLRRSGERDFVILERADDVGGTWRDNHYPGVACDVPSHLYSFSFRTNPDWSRVYSPGGEIQQYLRDCVTDEGLTEHLRLNTPVTDARWDADENVWTVTTPTGTLRGRFLVTGTGHLADAHLPEVDGAADFTGSFLHSAAWDHSVPLEGKRIGVVGTGASAIQIVPEMAKVASQLVVFQRTPAYMVPRVERDYTDADRRRFRRDPDAVTDLRSELFWLQENVFAQRRAISPYLEQAKATALAHLAEQVPDPALRAKLTPAYEPGCKRVLISSAFYPALQRPNVTLEASALARLEGGTAVAASGERYDLDVVVCATGFEATQPPFADLIHGREGISLADSWDCGMEAYDSIAVHGFPNLFMLNGPNTSLGHNSIVYIIEAQLDHLMQMLEHTRAHGIAALEPTREAQDEYVRSLGRTAEGTVWTGGGCDSWYLDPRSGRLTLIWPDFGFAFRQANGTFHADGYRCTYADSPQEALR